MSAHLTQEELTDNLLGASSLTVNAHLLNCPACAGELRRLKASIADFRGAAQSWSETAALVEERGTQQVLRSPARSRFASRWILVAALVLCIVGTTAYLRQQQILSQSHSTQPTTAPAVSQSQLDQDNLLMSQVSGELAEEVPAAMRPLLISESVASRSATTK